MGGEGRPPLFRACADGDFRVVRILLESIHFKSPLGDKKRQKEYIDRKNNPLYQHTPFYMAAWRGFLDIMQYLEELNADIELVDNIKGGRKSRRIKKRRNRQSRRFRR